MMSADSYKAAGNKAFSEGNFDEAIKLFTQAIECDASNHVFYSNRSACYASLSKFEDALKDAEKTVELAANWPKSYSRLAAAHQGLRNYAEALEAIDKGLAVDPKNAALLKSRDELSEIIDRQTSMSGESEAFDAFTSALKDPAIWTKISTNPKTSAFLADSTYCAKLSKAIENPSKAIEIFANDDRFIMTLLALMGVDSNFGNAGAEQTAGCSDSGCTDSGCGAPQQFGGAETKKSNTSSQTSHTYSPPSSASGSNSKSDSKHELPKKEEEVELDPQQLEIKAARDAAAAAYRKRDFDTAQEKFQQAFELGGEKDPVVLNNIAAVHFERREFEKCIEVASRVVELARTTGAGFEVVARAYARMGRAYESLEKIDEAVSNYKSSLVECRNPDILKRLQAAEKEQIIRKKAAYHSVDLSDKARDRGNAHFSSGRFDKAVPEYTEAIKRNETDPRAYANRSACYFKLGAFPEALKDSDRAIELDPTYVKAYVRKANVLLVKKDYAGAIDVCEKAEEINETAIEKATEAQKEKESSAAAAPADSQETNTSAPSPVLTSLHKQRDEISGLLGRCLGAIQEQNNKIHGQNADPKLREEAMANAMRNPEIQAIMTDPTMRIILDEMATNPRAAQAHMNNPMIASKIRKLVAAGIVSTR